MIAVTTEGTTVSGHKVTGRRRAVEMDAVEPSSADAALERRIRESFRRLKALATIGAHLGAVRRGEVEVVLPFNEALTQQSGFIHGGIVGMIADCACAYAAVSRLPEGRGLLTAEYKVNLLAPARGERLRAVARVVRSGRRLTVCVADVFAEEGDTRRHVALVTASLLALEPDLANPPIASGRAGSSDALADSARHQHRPDEPEGRAR